MNQVRSFADNRAWIFFHEPETDHARNENGPIRAFRVPIDVAQATRHRSGDIRHTRCKRSINIAAELRPDGPPKLVVSWMTGVRRLDSPLQQQQGLLARSPRASVVLKPLLPELLHRESNPIF